MKHTIPKSLVFGSFGLAFLAASGGCSSDDSGTPLGGVFGGTPGAGGSSAGSFTTPAAGTGTSGGGTTATGGTSAGTSNAGTNSGGTLNTAGTFNTAGTGGAAGTGAGGTAGTGGAAGTAGTGGGGTAGTGGGGAGGGGAGGGGTGGGGAGGTSAGGGGTGGTSAGAGGTGGTPGDDFPVNCPAPSATAHSTDKLTRSCWKASASSCSLGNDAGLVNPPSNTLDADLATRFSTGVNMTASQLFTFDVDMGKAVMINGVSTTTTAATDAPPQIEVDVSTDGTTWTPVACGANGVAADISFTAVSARYVRLIQHGLNTGWWSLTDIQVYRSTATDTCDAGNTTTACTAIGTAFPDTCCGASHKI